MRLLITWKCRWKGSNQESELRSFSTSSQYLLSYTQSIEITELCTCSISPVCTCIIALCPQPFKSTWRKTTSDDSIWHPCCYLMIQRRGGQSWWTNIFAWTDLVVSCPRQSFWLWKCILAVRGCRWKRKGICKWKNFEDVTCYQKQ